jgi:hypothetical protein
LLVDRAFRARVLGKAPEFASVILADMPGLNDLGETVRSRARDASPLVGDKDLRGRSMEQKIRPLKH